MGIFLKVQPVGYIFMLVVPFMAWIPDSLIPASDTGGAWTLALLVALSMAVFLRLGMYSWRKNSIMMAIAFTIAGVLCICVGYIRLYRGLSEL
jgi:hypothetical protein